MTRPESATRPRPLTGAHRHCKSALAACASIAGDGITHRALFWCALCCRGLQDVAISRALKSAVVAVIRPEKRWSMRLRPAQQAQASFRNADTVLSHLIQSRRRPPPRVKQPSSRSSPKTLAIGPCEVSEHGLTPRDSVMLASDEVEGSDEQNTRHVSQAKSDLQSTSASRSSQSQCLAMLPVTGRHGPRAELRHHSLTK